MEIIFQINFVTCHSYLFAIANFPSWYFLRHPDIKKQKLRRKRACEIKKNWSIFILKGFVKQTAIKKSLAFLGFSFLIDCSMSVFSLSLSKHL